MAGYSNKSLTEKLGIQEGMRLMILHPPAEYWRLLGRLPESVKISKKLVGKFDLVHYFAKRERELTEIIGRLRQSLLPAGALWLSWPKGSANVPTDLAEGSVRAVGLANGLVDIKVAAIDQTWSGLKFVIRKKDR